MRWKFWRFGQLHTAYITDVNAELERIIGKTGWQQSMRWWVGRCTTSFMKCCSTEKSRPGWYQNNSSPIWKSIVRMFGESLLRRLKLNEMTFCDMESAERNVPYIPSSQRQSKQEVGTFSLPETLEHIHASWEGIQLVDLEELLCFKSWEEGFGELGNGGGGSGGGCGWK